jgi:PAS domain S-box-containing protein
MTFLLLHILRSFRLYRRRTAIILAGALIPFLLALVALTQPVGVPPFTWTAIGLTVTGVLWYRALFRHRLLDSMPIVRDTIVDNMDDVVLILDGENRLVDLNPAGERMLGRSRREVIGQLLVDLSALTRTLLGEISATRAPRSEVAVELGPGEMRYYDLRVSVVGGGRGEVHARVAVLRDVTERVRLLRDLDAYAHTVAHDLKNPLTNILVCFDLLQDAAGKPLEGELLEIVEGAGRAANKMWGIIDGLLLLASIRRRRDVPRQPVDMGPLVESVLRTRLGSAIPLNGSEIHRPPRWPVASGYAPWIEEVWANYLSNAVKYGGQPPQIDLGGTETGDGFVRFWVRDNGSGLTEEERGQLFREFTRLQTERAEGQGLGLSIVRRIVERLGGRVGVDSAPGQGSTFWFTLPS